MKIHQDLYNRIKRSMPIPCVDLMITDPAGRILLVKRKNTPAQGSWWFPGGRVHFGELRKEAAIRKLKEECGLTPINVRELGTHDLLLRGKGKGETSHAITTVFHMAVNIRRVRLDEQSSDAAWKNAGSWLRKIRQPFIKGILKRYAQTSAMSMRGQ